MLSPRLLINLGLFTLLFGGRAMGAAADAPIRVVVWDEQQPEQKRAYGGAFLGEVIAAHLRTRPGLTVKTARLDDPDQGLGAKVIGDCEVLVWWGHKRHGEIKPETGRRLVERVRKGTLSLIVLHSAHFSTPFMEAMATRTREDFRQRHPEADDENVEVVFRKYARYVPRRYERLQPFVLPRKFPDGRVKLSVQLPNCCFPAYRPDGKPSTVTVRRPEHPIAKGLPRTFTIRQTEMYDEPFHVPAPDVVVFDERWAKGEWFRSGALWNIGRGQVFYFRPGHETYPVFKDPNCLKVVHNAVHHLAARLRKAAD